MVEHIMDFVSKLYLAMLYLAMLVKEMYRICICARGIYIQLTLIMHSETTRKQKISTLFISTFSFMCSIYRHVCSVFFLKYDIYKQPQAFVALEWSILKSYMLKET